MAFFKKSFVFGVISFAALGLVACDDSSSANGPSENENPTEVSSSSTKDSGSVEDSSSSAPTEDLGSSSSVKATEQVDGSSSSVTSSGGSAGVEGSSSSSVILSSSSEESSIKDGSEYNASANTLTDLRDGQVYKTVTIGTQTWMAENLNYAYIGVKFNYNGNTSDSTSWCYDNDPANCEKYGRLYTWSAVMDSAAQFSVNAGTKCGYDKTCTPNNPHRGICPEGWHVPTKEEYDTLYTFIGGESTAGNTAGKLLKSTTGWKDYNGKIGNGIDSYGFSVLPAGHRDDYGYFRNEGADAGLWSASEYSSDNAWYLSFFFFYGSADQYTMGKCYGFSLRCLKD